jgi:hypothetical protein
LKVADVNAKDNEGKTPFDVTTTEEVKQILYNAVGNRSVNF